LLKECFSVKLLVAMSDINTGQSPFDQFNRWYEEYVSTNPKEPTAMTLSSLGADGWPQARVVLLKNHDKDGFTFFTNYESHKSQQLKSHPKAQLLFFWDTLARQVRIWGEVSKTSQIESDEYFATRHYVSQLGAWASRQSEPLASREELIDKVEQLKIKYPEGKVPRPPHWGGWRLKPTAFEFWQGRENRLHDRFLFQLENGNWKAQRLNP
jgi:pyridoxamine 5'-phosphate oxidase